MKSDVAALDLMGNKSSVSPTESIQHLLDGNVSFKNCSTEEVATHLGIVVFLAETIATGEIVVTHKELKDLLHVYGVVIGMLDELSDGTVTDSYATNCLKKALHAILRLLVIPQISKKMFEASVASITNHLNTNDFEVFSLSFLSLFLGFRHLDDNPPSTASLSSVGDEVTRNSICLILEKAAVFPRLMDFLTQSSARNDKSLITTSVFIFRFISWILTRVSTSTTNLRTRLRQLLLQRQDTLFELSRHPILILRDASVEIMVLILKHEDRATCVAFQV